MAEYFIRRGQTVRGPTIPAKIRELSRSANCAATIADWE
jgi:hypothetical protein